MLRYWRLLLRAMLLRRFRYCIDCGSYGYSKRSKTIVFYGADIHQVFSSLNTNNYVWSFENQQYRPNILSPNVNENKETSWHIL